MVSPDVYNTLSVTVFIPPVNPGATAIITASSNAAVISNECQSFVNATTLFKQYDSSDKPLKKMIISALNGMFV